MQKLLFALPALLALTTAAAAEPLPMNEGQLGKVAAGVDVSPVMSVLSTDTTSTNTSTDISSAVSETISSMVTGGASNTVYSTGVGSENVGATGAANTTIMGSITAPIMGR